MHTMISTLVDLFFCLLTPQPTYIIYTHTRTHAHTHVQALSMFHRCFELLVLLAGAARALPKIGCVNTVTLGYQSIPQPYPLPDDHGKANCTLLANAINGRNVTGVELRCVDFMGDLMLMVDGRDNSHLLPIP